MKNTLEIKVQVDPEVYRLIEKVMENIQRIETLPTRANSLVACF